MRKFMRTREPAHPHPHPHPHPHLNGYTHPSKTNGDANGGGAAVEEGAARPIRDETRSTLTSRGRYWSGSYSGCGSEECEGTPRGGPLALAPWEDDVFPPQRALHKRLAKNVVWMRPHELCARPTFRGAPAEGDRESDLERAARWSVEVGAVGSPALCDACAALALTPRLLARVAPPQSFQHHYTGAFRFMFWVFGVWREVVVDDRLPTRAGRLLASAPASTLAATLSHAHAHADFTLPLLEKAYAKLYGGYSAARGVAAWQALQDVSGGVVQMFSLRGTPAALTLQVLHSAVPRSTLVVAGAHVVCGLARVRGGAGDTLLRLRAASGRRVGSDAHWRALSAPDRDLLDQRALNYGEFWLSFEELSRWFSTLVLVHVGPDDWVSEPALRGRRPWRAVLARRRWRAGYNAGGPPHARTAAANPQFRVSVPDASGGKCHVVVSVTQQYRPGADRAPHSVGFAVYQVPAEDAAAAHLDLRALRLLDVTHCSRAREVATFFTLPAGAADAAAGQYLVVPHTQRAHTEAAFLLRIFTDEHTHVWEVNEDNAILDDISAEFLEEGQPVPMGVLVSAARLLGVGGRGRGRVEADAEVEAAEVEAARLAGALRRVWRACLVRRPSPALCRALVALRDRRVRGALPAIDLPALVQLLQRWRAAFLAEATGRGCGCRPAVSTYRAREALRRGGLSCSNKVVECVVARYSQPRARTLDHEDYVMALARLYLAHERYRSLDSKLKSNPLSLEEMILMTIYS